LVVKLCILVHFDYFQQLFISCRTVVLTSDKEMVVKIVRSLGLTLPPVVTDAKTQLQSLFNQWLPLSQAVLGKDWRQFDATFLPVVDKLFYSHL